MRRCDGITHKHILSLIRIHHGCEVVREAVPNNF